ncbi:protein of unknown function [Hyphomicrobium sp. 1Nfss2.1]
MSRKLASRSLPICRPKSTSSKLSIYCGIDTVVEQSTTVFFCLHAIAHRTRRIAGDVTGSLPQSPHNKLLSARVS